MTNLYAQKTEINYENFIAQCPYPDCENENIFNRASDLKAFKPISFMEVECFKCKRKFYIKSDEASEKHAYLIYDCAELLKKKRYMYCIINLCTACEAFFIKGIEIKLLWEPWKEKVFQKDTDIFNDYSRKLHKKTQGYTYFKLRNVFFDLYLYDKSFDSQTTIDEYIRKINSFEKRSPKDEDIKKYHDPKTADLFWQLKELKINEIRNDVAHRYAVRPCLQQVLEQKDRVSSVLFGLEARLKLKAKKPPLVELHVAKKK